MTTNVFDGNQGVIATDSRWSVLYGRWLIYVDDSRFEKIERFEDFAFMFAGKGSIIQLWKSWIRSKPADISGMPTCDGISVCIVEAKSQSVVFSERQDIIKEGAYFSGTGSRYAYLCWETNRNPLRCVESAKNVDVFTGGEVKYLNMTNGSHNLHAVTEDVTIDMVSSAIETRGMVMEIASASKRGVPFKLSDLAANDTGIQEVKSMIASGTLTPEAPCDGMHSEWSLDQKERLKGALSTVFQWKS